MNLKISSRVGAKFKLIVHKGDGVAVKETDWFHNLVLDTGLARMSAGTWILRCCVGSGNSNPITTQTALDNFIASTTTMEGLATNGSQVSEIPYYRFSRVKWRFGQGIAAGNLSEIGLGWGDSNLWNRALIKDINGIPTTITVLSDEYLDVISEVRDYPLLTSAGEFVLRDKSGAIISTHTYTARPYMAASAVLAGFQKINGVGACAVYNSVKGENVSNYPTGTPFEFATQDITHPTPTSMRVTLKAALNEANMAHKSIVFKNVRGLLASNTGAGAGYVFEIDPPITKANTQLMSYTFEMNWGRYESA